MLPEVGGAARKKGKPQKPPGPFTPAEIHAARVAAGMRWGSPRVGTYRLGVSECREGMYVCAMYVPICLLHTYMHIHIYIYVHICMFTRMCLYIYMYLDITCRVEYTRT